MATPLIASAKPKTARSKRAALAREPVQVETSAKTAILVKGTSTSDKVRSAMADIALLKKPNCVNFSKGNTPLHPFEDTTSLSFWSKKNDASLFLVGSHSKKRPDLLTWARCFNGEVMELLETQVVDLTPISAFKGLKSTMGSTPLFHFTAVAPFTTHWESHPVFAQFKSLMLDFYKAQDMDAVSLKGLERVISFTIGGEPEHVTAAAAEAKAKPVASLFDGPSSAAGGSGSSEQLPQIHMGTYTLSLRRSGFPTPLVSLTPHGPFMSLALGRTQPAAPELWKAAMKRRQKRDSSKTKDGKNKDVDEMGDKVGRIYLKKQDLVKDGLETRKFKALKRIRGEKTLEAAEAASEAADDDAEGDEGASSSGRRGKKQKR